MQQYEKSEVTIIFPITNNISHDVGKSPLEYYINTNNVITVVNVMWLISNINKKNYCKEISTFFS